MQLLDANSADVISEAQENYSYLQTVFIWGEFDGAIATLQGSPDGNEWFDLAQFSHKHVLGIGLNVRFLRAAINGAGASTVLSMIVE